jgi:Rad3-related DNA helicase
MSAPVGSGKTGVARGISSRRDVIALAQTKLLQETVYREHGFDVLLGRGNYRCVSGETDKVDTCPYTPAKDCYDFPHCLYQIAKRKAMGSPAASLNYSFYLAAMGWLKQNPPPHVMVLDECHLLPDITLDYVGIEINAKNLKYWDLPFPPKILANLEMDLSQTSPPSLKGARYLELVAQSMRVHVNRLSSEREPKGVRKHNRAKRLMENASRTATLIQQDPNLWFVQGQSDYFRAKPLTARYHFLDLFGWTPGLLMMSATIGDPTTFAKELGIKEYDFRDVPSRFAPDRRPIVALDAPRLGYKSTALDYDHQADIIAQAITAFDPAWSGVIHVNRKDAAPLLADRLARRGLQGRIWVTPEEGTDAQMAAWVAHKRKAKDLKDNGPIAVTWAWHEGVDLGEEKICISAKVPFTSLGDEYEKARFNYSRGFYTQRAAWGLQQQLGRTRRGREEDYDDGDDVRGLVAIADGNWTRVKKYLSSDFMESVIEEAEVA